MKRLILSLALVGGILWGAAAQSLSFGFGDTTLDAQLNDLNATAKADTAGFTGEVALQWGVSKAHVSAALTEGLQPAEVYVAAFLSHYSGKSVDAVVKLYKKDKKAGWGALAKKLGIKPGSPAFKALKEKSKTAAEKGHMGKGEGKSADAKGVEGKGADAKGGKN